MKKVTFLLILTFIVFEIIAQNVVTYIQNAPPVNNQLEKEGWDLVMNDEFQDTILSATNWIIFDSPQNEELISDDEWPILINDLDILQLSIEKFNSPQSYTYNCGFLGGSWTEYCTSDFKFRSNKIRSAVGFNHGFFEIRCKMPIGYGCRPSFWLFANDNEIPLYNELDIFENFPLDDISSIITSNVHVDDKLVIADGNYGQHEYLGRWVRPTTQYYLAEKDLHHDWQTYSCEWGEDYIIWYLNNIIIKEIHSSDRPEIESIISKLKLDMKIILGVGLRFENVTYNFPQNTEMLVDYIRVYKKKPSIIINAANCSSSNIQMIADSEGENIYQWSVNSGGQIVSVSDNIATLDLFGGSENMEICVTATNNAGHSSSECIIYPGLDAGFEISSIVCQSNDIRITVNSSSIVDEEQSSWGIYHSDAEGNIIDWQKINNDLFGNQVIFSNLGLQYGNDYVIEHGVWNQCVDWTVEYKHINLSLSDFEYESTSCTDFGVEIRATSLYSFIAGNRWDLYYADEFGNIIDSESVSTQWENDFSYSNLEPNSWYILKHGISGNCVEEWAETRKIIYSPSFPLDSEFNINVANNNYSIEIFCSAVDYECQSEWTIFQSDSLGNILNLITGPEDGSFVMYDYSYNLRDSLYYVITHGVKNQCSNWQYTGYLVNGEYSEIIYLENIDFLVFPNPARDKIIITGSKIIEDGIIELYTNLGQLLLSVPFHNSNEKFINIEKFQSGLYIIVIKGEGFVSSKKLVKH